MIYNNGKEHEKEATIIVNGRPKDVSEKKLSYQQVIIMAFGQVDTSPNVVYTVTYSKGNGDSKSMVDGDTTTIKKGMVFNVSRTDKS